MNKILGFGTAAAAVVVAVVLGARLLGPPTPSGPGAVPTASPSASAAGPTAVPSVAAPSASPAFLSEGSHVLTDASGGVPVTVSISAPGWYGELAGGILSKNENIDPPDGAGLITFAFGDGWYVPGDPCQWESSLPDAAAATVDEFVAALAAQTSRDASTPRDITVGGYDGKSITLHVPNDAVFSSCDKGKFCSWGNPVANPSDPCFRYHQGPGQINELTIVDVNGELVIIDAGHYEATPPTDVDEMRAIVESATFDQ